jgi:hypothetical protein
MIRNGRRHPCPVSNARTHRITLAPGALRRIADQGHSITTPKISVQWPLATPNKYPIRPICALTINSAPRQKLGGCITALLGALCCRFGDVHDSDRVTRYDVMTIKSVSAVLGRAGQSNFDARKTNKSLISLRYVHIGSGTTERGKRRCGLGGSLLGESRGTWRSADQWRLVARWQRR